MVHPIDGLLPKQKSVGLREKGLVCVAQADDDRLRWTPVADPSRPKPPRLDGAGGGGAAVLAMPVGQGHCRPRIHLEEAFRGTH